jgi:hypothetical protein
MSWPALPPRSERTAAGVRTRTLKHGPSAHECITRPQGFCGFHDPEEGETGLYTARFWTLDNRAVSSQKEAQPGNRH